MKLMRGIQLLPFTRLVRRFGGAMTFSGLVGQSFMFGLIHTAPIRRKQHRKPKHRRDMTAADADRSFTHARPDPVTAPPTGRTRPDGT